MYRFLQDVRRPRGDSQRNFIIFPITFCITLSVLTAAAFAAPQTRNRHTDLPALATLPTIPVAAPALNLNDVFNGPVTLTNREFAPADKTAGNAGVESQMLAEYRHARDAWAKLANGQSISGDEKQQIARFQELLPALSSGDQEREVRYALDNNGGTFYTFTGNQPVPSAGSGGSGTSADSTFSTIVVSGFVGTIGDIEVSIDSLYHTYDSDLRFSLRSPAGTLRGLIWSCGSSSDNFMGTLLDDEAPITISSGSAPFNAVNGYRPEETLSAFDGQNPNGTWTLILRDQFSGDSGFLKGWTLQIAAPPPSPDLVTENLTPCGTIAPNPAQTIALRVRNIGGGNSAATTARYDYDAGFTTDAFAVPPLAPSSFFDVFFVVPVNLTPGPHTLSGSVDAVPAEINLVNNFTTCGITAERPCPDCTPADANLDPVPAAYGTTVSGNCGNGGKWVGSFTTIAGREYHFDVCNQLPGNGDASFDIDLKITDNLCNILIWDDGPSGCGYHSQDFAWIAPTSGTYYLVFAPFPASGHNCTGIVLRTFTLDYYETIPPIPPPNDDCASAISLTIPSSTPGTTRFALSDAPAPPFCDTSVDPAPGLWYTVIGNGHTLTAGTCDLGTNYDSKIHVYTGTCGAWTCVAGNDDNCALPGQSLNSEVSWCSDIGTEYTIYLSGYSTDRGEFVLNVSDGPCCNPRVHNTTQTLDYCTINAAIAAANPFDVINVDAGTFNENVVIDRAVTLNGPNAAIDPRTDCGGAARLPEAVIDGNGVTAAVQIAADGVTLRGFTIKGGENVLPAGIYVDGSRQGYSVGYNVITDNAIGMYANSAGPANIFVNLFTANSRPGPAGGSGIYSEITTALTISDNEFTAHPNNNPVIFAATAPSVHSTLLFRENYLHDDYGLFALGINGATITGNRMSATAGATACTFGGGCMGVDFNNNFISNSVRGLRIADFGYGLGDNSDFEAHGNSFDGPTLTEFAVGVLSGYTSTFDASNNWWGSNAYGIIPLYIDNSGAPVDYTPWLNSGLEPVADPCDGFQGSYSTLWVDDDSPQSGALDRVQEGVNSLTASTLYLAPGSYIGSVLITGVWTSGMNIFGPNAGVNPCSMARAPEAIMDGNGAEAIDIRSDNVTIDGLSVINALNGIVVNQLASNVSVRNNIVSGCSDTGINLWRAATAVVQNNQVVNCAIAGISGGDDAGTPAFGDDVPTAALIADNCLTGNRLGITGYHSGSNILRNSIGSFAAAPPAAGISGQMLNSLVAGNTVTGYTASAGISFTPYPNRPNSASVTVDSNRFSGNAAGLYIIDPVTSLAVTRNYFSNSTTNAVDVNPSFYDLNCWSDFALNGGFPAQYNVTGAGNVDFNPNPNTCANMDFVVTDPMLGCTSPCAADTLYLTFDQVGFIAGQIFLQLPPELDADWAPGTGYEPVIPVTNVATNLVFAAARRSAGNQIEINVQWQPPYSSGNSSQYIACIPFINVTGDHGDILCISGVANTFYDINGPHVNVFAMGNACVTIDCAPPVVAFTENTAPSCTAINSAASLIGAYTVDAQRGGLPNAPLVEGYIEVNGMILQRVYLITTTLPGNFNDPAVFSPGDAATIYGWLAEGCNTLVWHVIDEECNEGVSVAVTVIKDTQAPTLSATNNDVTFCYNNIASGSHYGGNLLDDNLDLSSAIDPTAAAPCAADSGIVSITYLGGPAFTVTFPPDLVNFPNSDAEALALWTWILTQVPPTANGESYTFNVTACDCAGNCAASSFTICIDLTAPANTVVLFDARPTDLGIWLKWSWNYAATQAVEMQVWRSPANEVYPTYGAQLWNQPGNPAAYVQAFPPPVGWTMVASQMGAVATTSTLFNGLNGKGNNNHSGPGLMFWEDEDASWVNNSEDRDIYRYVTFVRDNGGNWSQVAGYAINTNADRATNYWLGDYTRDLLVSPDASDGIVDGPDLGYLSGVYFTAVIPATRIFDIGTENAENGIGKGIPIPDGVINFNDLVPFSFNYGIVTPNSFNLRHPNTPEFAPQLDAQPVVQIERADDHIIVVGQTFLIAASLADNTNHSAKIVEAELEFDRNVLEVVSITTGSFEVLDGTPFVSARELDGSTGRIGMAGAALGDIATLGETATLALIEFRWKSTNNDVTELRIERSQMADGFGNILSGGGNTLTINAVGVIPRSFALLQNFPNPFNPSTEIGFDLPENSNVSLIIYNVTGQQVRTLVSDVLKAGQHRITWDGRDDANRTVGTGLYIYTIQAGAHSATKKMLLMR